MLSIILTVLGMTGVGGAVAIYVLAPAAPCAVMSVAASAATGLFRSMIKTRSGCTALALTIGVAAGWVWGDRHADQDRATADLHARLAAVEIDRDSQTERADHATRVLSSLQAHDAKNQEEIETLRQQVAGAALQSTQPGAKKDDQALMDDRCNLTERGARGLR